MLSAQTADSSFLFAIWGKTDIVPFRNMSLKRPGGQTSGTAIEMIDEPAAEPDIWNFLHFVNHPECYEVSVNRDRSFNVREAKQLDDYPTHAAGRVLTFLLNRFGFAGITVPWRVVYIHPDYMDQDWLIRHERQHIKQIDRDGAWLWSCKIVWYYIRYGSKYSPYELEARAAENEGQ